jgi:hypothetical protein
LAEVVLAIVSNSSSGCRLLQSQISAPAEFWSMIVLDHVIDAAGLIGCVLEMRWQQAICARGPAMLKETRRRDCARRHWGSL